MDAVLPSANMFRKMCMLMSMHSLANRASQFPHCPHTASSRSPWRWPLNVWVHTVPLQCPYSAPKRGTQCLRSWPFVWPYSAMDQKALCSTTNQMPGKYTAHRRKPPREPPEYSAHRGFPRVREPSNRTTFSPKNRPTVLNPCQNK